MPTTDMDNVVAQSLGELVMFWSHGSRARHAHCRLSRYPHELDIPDVQLSSGFVSTALNCLPRHGPLPGLEAPEGGAMIRARFCLICPALSDFAAGPGDLCFASVCSINHHILRFALPPPTANLKTKVEIKTQALYKPNRVSLRCGRYSTILSQRPKRRRDPSQLSSLEAF